MLDVTALLKALNEDITSLFKLSIAARKAGTRDRYAVALARIDPSRVLDEEREAEMIGDQCPRLSSPGLKWLRARLVKANNARRRYLKYCEEHQAHISNGDTIATDTSLPIVIPDDLQDTKSTASTANAALFDDIELRYDVESLASVISYATYTGTETLLRVRDLEEVRNGSDAFTCPYCKTEVAIQSQKSWRRHVFADMKAYVCLSESCGLRMFESSQAWLSHELHEHFTLNTCPYCGYQGSSQSTEDLKSHMNTQHCSKYKQGQLQDLLQASTHEPERISASKCPFCDWLTKIRFSDRSAPPDGDILVGLQRYRRHVGSHLEQVALAVITDETTEEDAERSMSDEEPIRPVDLDPSEVPDAQFGDDVCDRRPHAAYERRCTKQRYCPNR